MAKQFPIAAVLSVTTGLLLCEMGQVYEILNYLTSDNLFTHQLPRASEECVPSIHQQLPWTASPELAGAVKAFSKAIEKADETREAREKICGAFLDSLAAIYGATHELAPLAAYQHVYRDPLSEAVDIFGADRVIAVSPAPESEASNA